MNALMVLEALVVLLQDPCSERLSLHVHLTRSARTSSVRWQDVMTNVDVFFVQLLNNNFSDTLTSIMKKVLDKSSGEIISCSKFLDQLKKLIDEAGSSSVVQLLPNLPSSVKKWESPAREVLGSTEQCSGKYRVIFGSHTVLEHIGG